MNFYVQNTPGAHTYRVNVAVCLAAALLHYMWIDPEGVEHTYFLYDISSPHPPSTTLKRRDFINGAKAASKGWP